MTFPDIPKSNVNLHHAISAIGPAPVAVMDGSPLKNPARTLKGVNKSASNLRFIAARNSFLSKTNAEEKIEAVKPKKSMIVTLKVPSYKEVLRKLEGTPRRISDMPRARVPARVPVPSPTAPAAHSVPADSAGSADPAPVEAGPSTADAKDSQDSSDVMTKEQYIAWLLEDPDPGPPKVYKAAPLPSEQTKFEHSGLYGARGCMRGCSGPPPGTGCPVCKPVDFYASSKPYHPQWKGT